MDETRTEDEARRHFQETVSTLAFKREDEVELRGRVRNVIALHRVPEAKFMGKPVGPGDQGRALVVDLAEAYPGKQNHPHMTLLYLKKRDRIRGENENDESGLRVLQEQGHAALLSNVQNEQVRSNLRRPRRLEE
jgi:hypothetical protein